MTQTERYLEQAGRNPDISTLVSCVVLDAVDCGASDIHIEPWESSLVVRIRLMGVLQELVHLPLDFMERISGRLKVMADLVSYQTDLPQEGRAPADSSLGGVELRISVFPTVRGEKIVIRIFDPRNRSFELTGLGFDDHDLELFVKMLNRPSGLLLLTGPTGSGKTTAIYSALYHLVKKHGPAISISTVEDPVEFNLPIISQAQVNRAKEFTYPIALRSLMRQDPQVIMIGEIRDPETAAIAVQAGLTGHLVISTIHSGSTGGGICSINQHGDRAVPAFLQHRGRHGPAPYPQKLSALLGAIPAGARAVENARSGCRGARAIPQRRRLPTLPRHRLRRPHIDHGDSRHG